jgi:hypothetical protein
MHLFESDTCKFIQFTRQLLTKSNVHKNTISGPEISVKNTRTEMPSRGAKQAKIPRCISVWAISVTSLVYTGQDF